MDLYARIQEVSNFLSQENLAGQNLSYDPAKAGVALLVVDVQKKFCLANDTPDYGDEKTEAVAERVAALVPEFRKANIPVYLIHCSKMGVEKADEIDFYKVQPEASDTLVRKSTRSAFASSNIDEILKRNSQTKLLVCGVYLDQCVEATIRDARNKKYDIALLEDMAENFKRSRLSKENTLQNMKDNGVLITRSKDILAAIRAPAAQPQTTGAGMSL